MYRNLIHKIREVFRDPQVTRRIYLITLGAALLILVLAIRGPEENGKLLKDEDGNIVGIRRSSMTTSERYDVRLSVRDEEAEDRDLTLTVRAVRDAGPEAMTAEGGDANKVSREAEISAEVDNMVSSIEFSDQEVIELPAALPDGTPVVWQARKQEDRSGFVLIPVIYVLLIALVIKSGLDSGKDEEAEVRKQIMRSLPRFCNQLFLMMNAGMILSDAFERICESYSEYGAENMNVFEKELTDICSSNADHRQSTANLISEYASKHNVKELVRIAAILTENEKRGSDVIESLSRESGYLWDNRKIVARESGKMIDTKMSWPLALLLLILIIITMAPALMNM